MSANPYVTDKSVNDTSHDASLQDIDMSYLYNLPSDASLYGRYQYGLVKDFVNAMADCCVNMKLSILGFEREIGDLKKTASLMAKVRWFADGYDRFELIEGHGADRGCDGTACARGTGGDPEIALEGFRSRVASVLLG